MKKFYYLRHAQTDAHVQRKLCGGAWDLPLNSLGSQQAQEAAIMYAKQLQAVEIVYTSPLSRATQTAEIFGKHLKVPVVIIDNLKEWDLGDWDKKPLAEIPDFFERTDDPPNGETQKQFYDRIDNAIRPLISDSKRPLIISHGAVWYKLLESLNIKRQPISTCILKTIYHEGKNWICE